MSITKKHLDDFFEKRNHLIRRLSQKEITKSSFLEHNYELIKNLNMKPFLNISSIEEGMYNYQYYNILAKYFKQKAVYYHNKKGKKRYLENLKKAENYYTQKDKQLLQIIKISSPENMEGYFVEMYSKKLNSNLFEIVLKNMDFAIFHSMNAEILKVLRQKNVFLETTKKSKIDDYINTNI